VMAKKAGQRMPDMRCRAVFGQIFHTAPAPPRARRESKDLVVDNVSPRCTAEPHPERR
jgi:hypothetical protein